MKKTYLLFFLFNSLIQYLNAQCPVVNAGGPVSICASYALLQGSTIPDGFSASWSIVSGTGSIKTDSLDKTRAQLEDATGSVVVRYEVQGTGCLGADSATIYFVSTPTVSLKKVSSSASCSSEPVTFNAEVNPVSAYSYKWYINGVKQSVLTQQFTTTLLKNKDVVRVEVENLICPAIAEEDTVEILPLLYSDPYPLEDFKICEGSPLSLNLYKSSNEDKGSIRWHLDGKEIILKETLDTVIIDTLNPGIHNLERTIANYMPCVWPAYYSDKAEINVLPKIEVEIRKSMESCDTSLVLLQVISPPGPFYNFSWFKDNKFIGISEHSQVVKEEGNYHAEVINAECVSGFNTIVVDFQNADNMNKVSATFFPLENRSGILSVKNTKPNDKITWMALTNGLLIEKPNDTTTVVSNLTDGTNLFKVTVETACGEKVLQIEQVISSTENIQQLNAKIYPNPFNTDFTIDFNGVNYGIEILDLQGKIVESYSGSKTFGSNLEKGMYFLRIICENKVYSEKIIKQ